jgi:hypothetical protein
MEGYYGRGELEESADLVCVHVGTEHAHEKAEHLLTPHLPKLHGRELPGQEK